MAENDEQEPEGQAQSDPAKVVDPMARPALKGPGARSEKALGLEMARLFGLPPRLLVSPPPRPVAQSAPDGDGPTEGGSETAGDDHDGD
jgi:hypothetical protein